MGIENFDGYFSRREFVYAALKGAGIGLGLGFIPRGVAGWVLAQEGSTLVGSALAQKELEDLCRELTASWAQALFKLQIVDARDSDYGGIFCPTRKMVHGRVGETIYPFLHMARRTGDHRYVDASVLLFRWMEGHVSQPDGSWLNEVKDSWKGTTVFAVIALCEALRYHGELMDPGFRRALEDRLRKAGEFIYTTVNIDYGNINYPLSASYALSLLGTVQDVPRFRERGRELTRQAMGFFSKKDGFVFGEGTPYYQASPKGCFSVDLGYNIEETLPSLVMYGLLNKDEELLGILQHSLQTQMEFLLPDGGWDNSWGTRNYKWTYWGSRTSDGCQPAYALLADRDARFARVAYKNASLLKECTHEGLLYGGPHYLSHGVPTSVHHTFCHIKALTTVLDHGLPAASGRMSPISAAQSGAVGSGVAERAAGRAVEARELDRVVLPREVVYGSRFFADIQTWLISVGGWRATVTAYDREYKAMHNGHATGGTLSMLWHEKTGPLLVASMSSYQLVEAGNMQVDNDPLSMPLTPRVELIVDGVSYMSCTDLTAGVEVSGDHDRVVVKVRGKLVDKDQRDPTGGAAHWDGEYVFTPMEMELSFNCSDARARVVVPVVSRTGEPVVPGDRKMVIQKANAAVTVLADKSMILLATTGGRIFNFVPGLEAIPLGFDGGKARIRISVQGSDTGQSSVRKGATGNPSLPAMFPIAALVN